MRVSILCGLKNKVILCGLKNEVILCGLKNEGLNVECYLPEY